MSYDTLTLFIDTTTNTVINTGLSCNFPSGLLSLAGQYQRSVDFDWSPEKDTSWEPFENGVLDLDKYHVDAICVAVVDSENMMTTAIAGATYNVCTCGCHPLGEITERLYPQGCTITDVFERRLRGYFASARRIKVRKLLKLVTK